MGGESKTAHGTVSDFVETFERTLGSLLEDHLDNLEIAYKALAIQERLVARIEEQLAEDPVGWATIVIRTDRGTRTDSFPVGRKIVITRQGFRFSVDLRGDLIIMPTPEGLANPVTYVSMNTCQPLVMSDATVIVSWCDTREHAEEGIKKGLET